MLIGQYEVPQGAVILVAFVALVTVLLFYTWLKSARTNDELRTMAAEMNWTWAGSAPAGLTTALANLQDTSQRWSPSKIMVAEAAAGPAFLFHYQKPVSGSTSPSSSTSITRDGMACLVPGPVAANTAIFTIERKPLQAVDSYLNIAGDPIAGAGSEEFRERFLVQSNGTAYYGNETGAALANIDISPLLEAEMNRWYRPLGQPQDWTKVYVRSGLVLVTRNWRAQMSRSDWQALLAMCEGVSRALRAPL